MAVYHDLADESILRRSNDQPSPPAAILAAIAEGEGDSASSSPPGPARIAPSVSRPSGRLTSESGIPNGDHDWNSISRREMPDCSAKCIPRPPLEVDVQAPSKPSSAIISALHCSAVTLPLVKSKVVIPCILFPLLTILKTKVSPRREMPLFMHCSAKACCTSKSVVSPHPDTLGIWCPGRMFVWGIPSELRLKLTPQRSNSAK